MARKRVDREAFRHVGEEWRRGNVGRALFNATRRFEQDVAEVLQREGFGEIRIVHLNLYRNLDFDGTRLTDLAARANMTKQSMQELVDRAEQQGLVERRPDPQDRRAKTVAFSDRGLKLLDALHKGILYAEQQMISAIGASAVEEVAGWMGDYARSEPATGSAVKRKAAYRRGAASSLAVGQAGKVRD
jgi:DNA-binding MarR family transcriptional regulator